MFPQLAEDAGWWCELCRDAGPDVGRWPSHVAWDSQNMVAREVGKGQRKREREGRRREEKERREREREKKVSHFLSCL